MSSPIYKADIKAKYTDINRRRIGSMVYVQLRITLSLEVYISIYLHNLLGACEYISTYIVNFR